MSSGHFYNESMRSGQVSEYDTKSATLLEAASPELYVNDRAVDRVQVHRDLYATDMTVPRVPKCVCLCEATR